MKRSSWHLAVVAMGWAWAGSAMAQDVAHGQVNWNDKTITATGSGAPNLKNAGSAGAARIGAERAAKMDALRNILEAVKGVKVTSDHTAGSAMASSPQVKTQIEGTVQRFKVLETKYYSDGGVDVIVQVPLDGVITEALVTDAGTKVPKASDESVTGVVINAKGLSATPALAPRLVSEDGNEVYSAAMAAKDAVKQHGVVGYTKSVDAAMKDTRVAGKPLMVKATKLVTQGGSDLVVSKADAEKIAKATGALAGAKVIIVTD